MSAISKKQLTLILVISCVSAVIGIKFFMKKPPVQTPVDYSQVRTRGNPEAEIRVVEYIDFQCPACAAGSKVLKYYFDQNPNEIFLDLKYFPLAMHKHAQLGAQYAECAARQGMFWPFHDLIIDKQDDWKLQEDAEPEFQKFAAEVGCDEKRLQACLKEDNIDEVIALDKENGKALGVRSTPTYFVNDKMMVGPKSLRDFMLSHFKTQE